MYRENFLMNFNLLILFIAVISLLIVGFTLVKSLLKNRRRTPESIYKLIDDLEKKYIY